MKNRCKRHSLPQRRFYSNGATLIEILVSLLIVSVGVLGMAATQIRALKGNHSSMQRTQAVVMSYYILDAMRVDRDKAKSLDYNTGTLPVCDPASITGSTLAKVNLRHWIESVKDTIGNAGDTSTCGSVVCDADGKCTAKVVWDDTRAGGLGLQTVETQTNL